MEHEKEKVTQPENVWSSYEKKSGLQKLSYTSNKYGTHQ